MPKQAKETPPKGLALGEMLGRIQYRILAQVFLIKMKAVKHVVIARPPKAPPTDLKKYL